MRNKKARGILLVTTLFIITLLTALTIGFITINRDNLLFAQKVNASEAALQAAYAGLHYAMLRLEQDSFFGVSPNPNAGQSKNTASQQFDAFPDGRPGGYGSGGPYWSGSGYVIPFSSSDFTIYETGATVIGILNGNDSHFQIHFNHFGNTACSTYSGSGYQNNGFDDDSIAAGSFSTWNHRQLTSRFHSLNNLNSDVGTNSGSMVIPPYSAHLVSIGYSHGVSRTVEAMFKRVFFTNSSALASGYISIATSGASGNNYTTFGTLAPLTNNIEAGAGYTGGKFRQTGGDIVLDPAAQTRFFNSAGTQDAGNAYALRSPGAASPSSPGMLTLGAATSPSGGINFTSVSNGTMYGDADNVIPLPPKDLTGQDFLNQVNANPALDSSGQRYYPQTANTCWVNGDVIWAFKSNGGYGNQIQVYDFSGAAQGAPYSPGFPCVGSSSSLPLYGYKVMVPPGVHVVVGNQSTNTVQGNLMITLDPSVSNNLTNKDRLSWTGPYSQQNVLPGLALGYSGIDRLGGDPVNGNSPSSITLGGNLYVQGQIVGNGAVIVQSNTGDPGVWTPDPPFTSSTWANWIINNTPSDNPPTGTGGLSTQLNSQIGRDPNYSALVYVEGTTNLNTLTYPPSANLITTQDQSAFTKALNDIAAGTCSASGCTGGYWSNAIPNIGEPLNTLLDYSHDSAKLSTLFRSANNGGPHTGLNNGTTGVTVAGMGLSGDGSVTAYLTSLGLNSGSNLTLYQYAAISNYANTKDISWLNYKTPPSSGALDPAELFITSTLNQFGQQAYNSILHSDLGAYMGQGALLYAPRGESFQGFLYSKGSISSQAAFGFWKDNTFVLQGSMVSSQGSIDFLRFEFGGTHPSGVGLIYDPSYIQSLNRISGGGNPVAIQWIVVW